MYGYIYKTTNLINNKIYIGKHKSEIFDIKYKGSGQILKSAFIKYGKNNFSCSVIDYANSLEELNKKEIYWINKYREDGYSLYNITQGGDGTCGYSHTQETKDIISHHSKDRIWITKDNKNKFIKKIYLDDFLARGWFTGRICNPIKDPQSRKDLISQKNKNKIRMTNGKDNIFIPLDKKEEYEKLGYYKGVTNLNRKKWIWITNKNNENKKILLEEFEFYSFKGWMRGRYSNMSEEARNKLSLLNTNKPHPISEETKKKISDSRKNHVVEPETKLLISNTLKDYYQSEEGMRKRQSLSKKHKGLSNSTKNTIWVNNGLINKRVPNIELDDYISKGWNRGVK